LGQRCHLDEVETAIDGELPGLLDGDDAERFIGGVVKETNLRDADLLVDPQLSKGDGWKPPKHKNLDSDSAIQA
jgi:hypothetical protein